MPQIQLTPAERREYRADAHHLNPVVLVGGDGLTPAVQKEIDAALNAHGLIKVRRRRGASHECQRQGQWGTDTAGV